MVASFFVGLGPGGLKSITESEGDDLPPVSSTCLPGSNHGGNVPPMVVNHFQVGGSYDKENLTTFRGGSGGDAIHSISVFLFLYLSFLLASYADVLRWRKSAKYFRYHKLRTSKGLKHRQLLN